MGDPIQGAWEQPVPIIVKVDHQRKEIESLAVGPITYADVESHLKMECRLQGLAYPELLDARGAGILLTPAEIRQVVAFLRKLGEEHLLGPTAVVVSNDTAFGLVRMFEVLLEDVCEVRPFREEGEAREWLAALPTRS